MKKGKEGGREGEMERCVEKGREETEEIGEEREKR